MKVAPNYLNEYRTIENYQENLIYAILFEMSDLKILMRPFLKVSTKISSPIWIKVVIKYFRWFMEEFVLTHIILFQDRRLDEKTQITLSKIPVFLLDLRMMGCLKFFEDHQIIVSLRFLLFLSFSKWYWTWEFHHFLKV